MGEKDITEKRLEDFHDVFADIINVLLFNGERRVKPQDLADSMARSVYKADGKFHEQERDIAKYWTVKNVSFALFGLENQTASEKYMPIRTMSYDGADFRNQMREYDKAINERYKTKNKRKRETIKIPKICPAITLVLYFGLKKWEHSVYLNDAVDYMDDDLKQFVTNYKMNLFEIAYLSDEQVEMFQSDFHIVADYFVKTRKVKEGILKEYVPSDREVRHIKEVLDLLTVFTGDHRFEDAYNEMHKKGAPDRMCEVLDVIEQKGKIEGKAEGRVEGRAEGLVEGRAEGLVEGRAEGFAQGTIAFRHYIATTHPEYTDEQIEAIIAEFSASSNPAI